MYKERRPQGGNNPAGWTENFRGGASRLPRIGPLTLLGNPIWNAIKARVAPGATVLDAGSGLGEWIDLLVREGYRGVGVDFSEEMIGLMQRERPNARWIASDIRSIPLPDASVDAVISWGVVEHEEAGPGAALREFARVLRPGGWAFVTVPRDTPPQRASSRAQFGEGEGEFFQYYMRNDELGALMTEAGFAVDLLIPTNPHYAVLYPELYNRVERAPSPVRRVANMLLNQYARTQPEACGMVLAVGCKVGDRPTAD